jgi:D-arginine dehydrogenase
MDRVFDVIVIGAGMAGASAAAFLAPHRRVAMLEMEDAPGYHTTGRSAALWTANYGPPDVRRLTLLSRAFYETPPEGFATVRLFRRRPVLFLATAEQMPDLAAALAGGEGLRAITPSEAMAMLPPLRDGYTAGAAVEDDAFDMDVGAIHQGFLRQLRAHGGVLALRHRAGRIARASGVWRVETSAGPTFEAPIVINAAGAWGDEVAANAAIAPIGLVPKRRTAAIIDPNHAGAEYPIPVEDWPMVLDITERWYARPEARTRLLVSPADETVTHPHDVQPEEIDIATGIDRMSHALSIPVRRVEHAWAGLRTFTPDGSLAFGWDKASDGFFWCVGQGGYGIQTAPAAGRLVADLILGRDPGAAADVIATIDPGRFRGA